MTDSAPFRNRPMFLHQITMTIAASLGLQVFRTLFDNSAMAIRTFFQKIGDPEDIASSTAVGFIINHIGAVIPLLTGGFLWMIDYRIPFLVGAGLRLASFVSVQLITGHIRRAAQREVIATAAVVMPRD